MLKKALRTAVILVILISAPAWAGGGELTGGATEMTQLAKNSELGSILGQEVEQISNQVKQITNQIKQYTEMVKQGLVMPNSMINDVAKQFAELNTAVKQTDGLYKSVGNMAGSLKDMWNQPISSNVLENIERRSKQTTATLDAVTKKIDQTNAQIDADNKVIDKLHERSANAQGQMQALQTGNEIAATTAQEINKLRSDVNQLTALIVAQEADRQLAISDDKRQREMFKNIKLKKSEMKTDMDH